MPCLGGGQSGVASSALPNPPPDATGECPRTTRGVGRGQLVARSRSRDRIGRARSHALARGAAPCTRRRCWKRPSQHRRSAVDPPQGGPGSRRAPSNLARLSPHRSRAAARKQGGYGDARGPLAAPFGLWWMLAQEAERAGIPLPRRGEDPERPGVHVEGSGVARNFRQPSRGGKMPDLRPRGAT